MQNREDIQKRTVTAWNVATGVAANDVNNVIYKASRNIDIISENRKDVDAPAKAKAG